LALLNYVNPLPAEGGMGNFNVVVTYPSELEFDKSTYDIRGTELRIVQDNDPISVDIRTCAAFLIG
jgi:hypothetical protein